MGPRNRNQSCRTENVVVVAKKVGREICAKFRWFGNPALKVAKGPVMSPHKASNLVKRGVWHEYII